MDSKAKRGRQPDITAAVRAGVAALLLAAPVHAQLIDSTLDDIVEDQIDRDVEDEIADELEASVAGAVEEQVAADVAEAVQEQVASDVAEAVGAEIESAVTETIGEAVESGVTDALEQTLEGEIGDTVAGGLDAVLVGGEDVAGALDGVLDGLGAAVDELTEGVVDGVNGAGPDQQGPADQPSANERFFAGIDPLGRASERDVWVILVPAEFAARIPGWGFTIRERRDLPALQRVLLRVAAPEDRDIAQAALDLALDAPGTLVDFNHVYRDGAVEDGAAPRMPSAAAKPSVRLAIPSPTGLAIGIVDSAVATEHDALRSAQVVQQDFVPFAAERPTQHGRPSRRFSSAQARRSRRGCAARGCTRRPCSSPMRPASPPRRRRASWPRSNGSRRSACAS